MINKTESNSPNADQQIGTMSMAHYINATRNEASRILGRKNRQKGGDGNRFQVSVSIGADHPCANFTFPPPPPPYLRRIGPRRKFWFIILFLITRVALNLILFIFFL